MVVVVEGGRITAQGTHAQLVAQGIRFEAFTGSDAQLDGAGNKEAGGYQQPILCLGSAIPDVSGIMRAEISDGLASS